MKINLKQPKYVLPLLALPFLCLFFYVFHSGGAKKQVVVKQTNGINSSVGGSPYWSSTGTRVRRRGGASAAPCVTRITFQSLGAFWASA